MPGESVIMDFLRNQDKSQSGQQEKQIVYIDIDNLEASRENFYGIRDLEALKASISLHGLLQPLLVVPAKVEGRYTVLGGGRRRQAIEELVDEGKEELRMVPCILSDGKIQGEDGEEQETDEVKDLIGKLNIISANSFREKTDWEKLEETLQIGSIIKELKNLGKLKGDVRKMQVELSGVKGTQIARYNAIMNHLSVELMQAFKNNDFGISVAYELSKLSEDCQKQAWKLFLENKILTLADAERLRSLQKAEEEENLEGQMDIQEYIEQQEVSELAEDGWEDATEAEKLEEEREMPDQERANAAKTAAEPEEILKEVQQEEPQVKEQQAEPVAPAQQIKGCIHRPKYNCTLTEEQKEITGDGNNCNEKCCWNCTKHGMCRYECIASETREVKQEEWQQEEETEYNKIAIQDYLFEQEKELEEYEACEGLPARMMLRKRMIVDALKLLLANYEDAEEGTEEWEEITLPPISTENKAEDA